MGEFRMPSLGADMEAGKLVEWKVAPGDAVQRGQVVALVETEKGVVEVEVWESGVVGELLVEPGTKVPVGTLLATLAGPASVAAPQPPAAAAPVPAASHVLASPAAKQLAREHGVDLASVKGSGPHGVVTRDDVLRAVGQEPPRAPAPPSAPVLAAPAPPAAPPVGGFDAAAMRRAIAATMARSKREIPHYYLSADIDLTRARAWLDAENARRSVTERLLFASVLLRASALAIREVPEINGFFVDEIFRPSQAVHVGVAISLRQGGLVAPAIHDVDRKSVADVQAALLDLVARARAGRLRSSEMSDPTITVTNLGDQGVDAVFGVIYRPQVALVGFGRVAERPWASEGMLGVRAVVTATLAADHRVSDGHRGAVYLRAIDRLLQKPEEL